ncbi:FAD-dependent oxidoreductase [Actinomycetes bacterium KLBMP 9797]
MSPTVAVVGGGYAGIIVAKALDEVADVTLVEPRETFVHNVAALRAVVDPTWADQLFIPYDGLLARGRVVRDRAVQVTGGTVELASGDTVAADYIVLATGSGYPYPAKLDVDDRASGLAKLAATRDALLRADRVLLLGAGPVGLEFAGEIKAAWPEKAVTIVDPAGELLPRFPDEVRAELRRQLDDLGIEVLLGAALRALPPTAPGEVGTFTVTTASGVDIGADVWFPCFGVTPNSDYLGGGHLAVTPELRVAGHETVFAVGDVTAVPEAKMAYRAEKHAAVVAANIRTLIEGGTALAAYEPESDGIVLPLGPKGGVSYAAEMGLLGPEVTQDIKGTFFLDIYRDRLGATRS